jgi:hypothetical protein
LLISLARILPKRESQVDFMAQRQSLGEQTLDSFLPVSVIGGQFAMSRNSTPGGGEIRLEYGCPPE